MFPLCSRWYLAVLVLLSVACSAAEVEHLETTHESGTYTLEMTVLIAAPRDAVFGVLTDYERLSAINPAIKVSEVLASDEPGVSRVRTVIRRCVVFYCPRLERVEDVMVLDDGTLEAVLVPELSDFKEGYATWAFEGLDDTTRIVYRARFDPDFWVPPLIGPPMVKGALRDEARVLFDNAERRAREAAGLPLETTE
jgi:hypothetical protein